MPTVPASPPAALPYRPYQVKVTVSAPNSTVRLAVPEGSVHFEIRGLTGTTRWAPAGTESIALPEPYDALAAGSSYSMPDKLNFEAPLPDALYFDSAAGLVDALVIFT